MFDRALGHFARLLVLTYRYTLSAFIGRQCRYLPTCSDYSQEAFKRYGFWAGGWMTLARMQRCRPGGDSGFDPVPKTRPEAGRWYKPWRYGVWRMPVQDGET
ncbi:MAG: membrane protein insertion efficiency factor YidD [Pseudomonadota bacterium]